MIDRNFQKTMLISILNAVLDVHDIHYFIRELWLRRASLWSPNNNKLLKKKKKEFTKIYVQFSTEEWRLYFLIRRPTCVQNIYQMPYFSSEPRSFGVCGDIHPLPRKMIGLLLQSEQLPRPLCQYGVEWFTVSFRNFLGSWVGCCESLLTLGAYHDWSPWTIIWRSYLTFL